LSNNNLALTFNHQQEWPKSTTYEIKLCQGFASSLDALPVDALFKFSTPVLSIVSVYPTGGIQSTDPIMVVRFNQRVEPNAILKCISFNIGGILFGKKNYSTAILASAAEIQQDKNTKRFMETSEGYS